MSVVPRLIRQRYNEKRAWFRALNTMEYLKLLYGEFGIRYPVASLIFVCAIGAILFGSLWWLIGKQYQKSLQVRETSPAIEDNFSPSPPTKEVDPKSSPNTQAQPQEEALAGTPTARPSVAIRAKNVKGLRVENNLVIGMELLDVSDSEDVSTTGNIAATGLTNEQKLRAFEAWATRIEQNAGDTTETEKWLEEVRADREKEWETLPLEERQIQMKLHADWEARVLAGAADRTATLRWLARVRKRFYDLHKLPRK